MRTLKINCGVVLTCAPARAYNSMSVACSRQQVMLRPLLLRGMEVRHLTLGGLQRFVNVHTTPLPMIMIILAIHAAKSNKDGKHDDWRVLTRSNSFTECPLVHLAIHFAQRMFLDEQSDPFPESVAESADWCAHLTISLRLTVIRCPPMLVTWSTNDCMTAIDRYWLQAEMVPCHKLSRHWQTLWSR